MIDDLAGLLWVINLGCIDLNDWYSRCDDTDRPDYLHFDLDPVKDGSTTFATVRTVALHVHDGLESAGDPRLRQDVGLGRDSRLRSDRARPHAKGRVDVREGVRPDDGTSPSRRDHRGIPHREAPIRPRAVDYNQNAWGKTLASVYSVRARPRATVSAPVTWDEVAAGIEIEDFRLDKRGASASRGSAICGRR